jgi:hypothetical protein
MSATGKAVPGTVDTFRGLAGGLAHVPRISLSRGKPMRWVARDLGAARRASALRDFGDKADAVAWWIQRKPAPEPQSRRAAA